jgi:hypothetical protein
MKDVSYQRNAAKPAPFRRGLPRPNQKRPLAGTPWRPFTRGLGWAPDERLKGGGFLGRCSLTWLAGPLDRVVRDDRMVVGVGSCRTIACRVAGAGGRQSSEERGRMPLQGSRHTPDHDLRLPQAAEESTGPKPFSKV